VTFPLPTMLLLESMASMRKSGVWRCSFEALISRDGLRSSPYSRPRPDLQPTKAVSCGQ
jgi:hypothetical protein